ncbi:amidase signature enzyme [Schizophyllum commune Tattone D]|nr:amidase signature enzyme [Schizophyllum commune Tattone D]
MWPFSNPNQHIIDAKLKQRAKALALAPSFNEAAYESYLNATACEIVSNIEKGVWKASEVLEAYISRAAKVQEATNCLTEVLFERARERAAALDAEFAQTKRLKGPLHGVPISVKAVVDIEGVDTTIGFSQWAKHGPATRDADLVATMISAGAIPFVKTNVPQTMFAFESVNPLWGRTLNPHNPAFGAGGSSGGEAALIGGGGSPLGLGSDVGGSLRIPTAFCGIYSLKPGAGRVSAFGARGPVKGMEAIRTTMGPMARSIEDLERFSRVAFGQTGRSADVAPLPYRDVTLPEKLKFGYYTSDNIIKASPACARAVLETVEGLRKAGHECVEIVPYDAPRGFATFVALTSADGYETLTSHISPDPKEDALFLVTLGPKAGSFLRAIAGWVVTNVIGDAFFASLLRLSRAKPVKEFWKFTAERDAFAHDFYENVWEKHQLDGIIAPVLATPQLPHGGCKTLTPMACGTALYNLVDSPVGILPVSRVDPEKDALTDAWRSEAGHGSKMLEKELYSKFYDPVAMKGMPIAVQVVGRRWEEEKVVEMMKIVDGAVGTKGFGMDAWKAL